MGAVHCETRGDWPVNPENVFTSSNKTTNLSHQPLPPNALQTEKSAAFSIGSPLTDSLSPNLIDFSGFKKNPANPCSVNQNLTSQDSSASPRVPWKLTMLSVGVEDLRGA